MSKRTLDGWIIKPEASHLEPTVQKAASTTEAQELNGRPLEGKDLK